MQKQKLEWVIFEIEKENGKEVVNPKKSFPSSEEDVKAFEADKAAGEETYLANWEKRCYAAFEAAMQEKAKEPCYCVIDFRFKAGDDGARSKLTLINWVSDSAPVKTKMLVASSSEAVKTKFGSGLHCKVQVTSLGEFAYEELKARVPQK